MLVPETTGSFRATMGALRSFGEGEIMSIHTFLLLEDRCVRILLNKLGKPVPESEIMEELEALNMNLRAVMQLRSKRRLQDPEEDGPLSVHFFVSVSRRPDVAKVRSLTDL